MDFGVTAALRINWSSVAVFVLWIMTVYKIINHRLKHRQAFFYFFKSFKMDTTEAFYLDRR